VLLHTGNMGLKQGLDELVPSLAALELELPDVLVVFVGEGNQAANLRASVSGLRNVSVLPLLPDADYQPTLAAADICLLHERSTSADMSMPSKLGSYFTAARPVLAVVRADGAAAAEVRAAGAGLVVPQQDPAALVEAVRRLGDPTLAEQLGRSGRAYAERELDRQTSLHRVAELLDRLVSAPTGA
jgi:glycosyltransferase involved in cell wall biosynthesis